MSGVGTFSFIIGVVLGISIISEGIYAIRNGIFRNDKDKAIKHEPVAYRKWVRLSGIFSIISGTLMLLFEVLDIFYKNDNNILFWVLGTVGIDIALTGISFILIVKPADKANGFGSEQTNDNDIKDDK